MKTPRTPNKVSFNDNSEPSLSDLNKSITSARVKSTQKKELKGEVLDTKQRRPLPMLPDSKHSLVTVSLSPEKVIK